MAFLSVLVGLSRVYRAGGSGRPARMASSPVAMARWTTRATTAAGRSSRTRPRPNRSPPPWDLHRRPAEGAAFERANQWRDDRIDSLDDQLRISWAEAVLDAARDGYPTAYGTGRRRAARRTLINQIEA